MLPNIDVSTVIILIIFAAILHAGVIITFAILVNEYQGSTFGVAGNICLAAGYTLLLFRNHSPDWLSIIVANGLLVVGVVFFYIALRRFTAQPSNRYLVIAAPVLCILGLSYFTYQDQNMAMRIITMSVVIIPVIGAGIMALLRADNKNYRSSIYLIIIPSILYSIVLVIRAINAWHTPPETVISNTSMQVINYSMAYMINFFWTTGFINMTSKRLQSDLRDSANTDILTGLSNRRAAAVFLANEFARQSRNPDYYFSVLILDLDLFKGINDNYGHDAGDYVLVVMSDIFRDMVRKQDFVARWGGDEFIIVAPLTTSSDAYALGKRLIERINREEFIFNQSVLEWTISIGVSGSRGCQDVDDLLKKADIALYKSKQVRNMVIQEA